MSPGFISGPVRALPRLRRTFAAGKPYKNLVIDDFLRPSLRRALRSDLAKNTDAAFLEGRDLKGSFAICRTPGAIGPGFARLESILGSVLFLKWLEGVTGVKGLKRNEEVSCGGLFRFDHDAEMDVHLDSNDVDVYCAQKGHPRKINLLLYLSHAWKEDWGGHFELYRDPSKPPVKAFAPLFNRCIIFDNHDDSWHGVTRVDLPQSDRHQARFVMISNYYSADKTGTKPAPPHHNIWMPRPLPRHVRPGYRMTLADSLEVSRLLARREERLRELRALRDHCRALTADGRREIKPQAPLAKPEPFAVLKALPLRMSPGRVLSRADLAFTRRSFAVKDRELRRLYARQFGYIQRLKKSAPHLVPVGY